MDALMALLLEKNIKLFALKILVLSTILAGFGLVLGRLSAHSGGILLWIASIFIWPIGSVVWLDKVLFSGAFLANSSYPVAWFMIIQFLGYLLLALGLRFFLRKNERTSK